MGRRVATLVTVLALGAPAAAPAAGPNVHWESLLAPLPSRADVQPGPQPGCEDPGLACIDAYIAELAKRRAAYGCDHRAVFATTYQLLSQTLRDEIASGGVVFEDLDYLVWEGVAFVELYLRTLEDADAGRWERVPAAWRVAFDTAARGDANAMQDMLLGVNAHVQRDMPYVLAKLGLVRPDGASRKPDHDVMNDVLNAAYEPVVRAVGHDYDPFVDFALPSALLHDDVIGQETVRAWREGVWRNAERLVAARTAAERRRVEASIEANALAWARFLQGGGLGNPGHRERRDAHCAAQLGR